eukprot:g11147.t1
MALAPRPLSGGTTVSGGGSEHRGGPWQRIRDSKGRRICPQPRADSAEIDFVKGGRKRSSSLPRTGKERRKAIEDVVSREKLLVPASSARRIDAAGRRVPWKACLIPRCTSHETALPAPPQVLANSRGGGPVAQTRGPSHDRRLNPRARVISSGDRDTQRTPSRTSPPETLHSRGKPLSIHPRLPSPPQCMPDRIVSAPVHYAAAFGEWSGTSTVSTRTGHQQKPQNRERGSASSLHQPHFVRMRRGGFVSYSSTPRSSYRGHYTFNPVEAAQVAKGRASGLTRPSASLDDIPENHVGGRGRGMLNTMFVRGGSSSSSEEQIYPVGVSHSIAFDSTAMLDSKEVYQNCSGKRRATIRSCSGGGGKTAFVVGGGGAKIPQAAGGGNGDLMLTSEQGHDHQSSGDDDPDDGSDDEETALLLRGKFSRLRADSFTGLGDEDVKKLAHMRKIPIHERYALTPQRVTASVVLPPSMQPAPLNKREKKFREANKILLRVLGFGGYFGVFCAVFISLVLEPLRGAVSEGATWEKMRPASAQSGVEELQAASSVGTPAQQLAVEAEEVGEVEEKNMNIMNRNLMKSTSGTGTEGTTAGGEGTTDQGDLRLQQVWDAASADFRSLFHDTLSLQFPEERKGPKEPRGKPRHGSALPVEALLERNRRPQLFGAEKQSAESRDGASLLYGPSAFEEKGLEVDLDVPCREVPHVPVVAGQNLRKSEQFLARRLQGYYYYYKPENGGDKDDYLDNFVFCGGNGRYSVPTLTGLVAHELRSTMARQLNALRKILRANRQYAPRMRGQTQLSLAAAPLQQRATELARKLALGRIPFAHKSPAEQRRFWGPQKSNQSFNSQKQFAELFCDVVVGLGGTSGRTVLPEEVSKSCLGGWMESPEHQAAILSTRQETTELAVGLALGDACGETGRSKKGRASGGARKGERHLCLVLYLQGQAHEA